MKPQVFAFAMIAGLAVSSAAHGQAVGAPNAADMQQVSGAVEAGLSYLARRQKDGSWAVGRGDGGDGSRSAGVTSLAVMAFLAAGHTPGQGPHGEVVERGVDYVLGVAEAARGGPIMAGSSPQWTMYEHGISAVMLCETYGMVDAEQQKRIRPAVANAVALILRAQRTEKPDRDDVGGWRYVPASRDADISVTGWQLMALRGAANIGAPIPRSSLDAGVAYIKRRASPTGGFAYAGNRDVSPARTGTGIVALELLGQHHTKEALDGGSYLLRNPINDQTPFYYYAVYYCSQAAHQLGGKYDVEINRTIRISLLKRQNANGSWSPGMGEGGAGENYATAMAVLALGVPYRYLPLYQR